MRCPAFQSFSYKETPWKVPGNWAWNAISTKTRQEHSNEKCSSGELRRKLCKIITHFSRFQEVHRMNPIFRSSRLRRRIRSFRKWEIYALHYRTSHPYTCANASFIILNSVHVKKLYPLREPLWAACYHFCWKMCVKQNELNAAFAL